LPPDAEAGVTGEARGDPPPPLILFAEDEDPVREMLSLAFRLNGFRRIPCADGQEAVERLEPALGVDLVLVDLRMPRLDGLGVIRHIRSRPDLAHLPVIAMSAYSDDLQQREVAEAGASAFLPKPFTIPQLLEAISGFVPRP
jgi:CheY-like chemotaxis protein